MFSEVSKVCKQQSLEQNDFDLFLEYLRNFEPFVAEVLKRESEEYFKKENRLNEILHEKANQIGHTILKAVDAAVDNPSDDLAFIESLLSHLDNLVVPQDVTEAFKDLTVSDRDLFRVYLRKHLIRIQKSRLKKLWKLLILLKFSKRSSCKSS